MLSRQAQAILDEMYSARMLEGADGPVAIDEVTRISRSEGAELRRLVQENSVRNTLEVGLAYGFSTIWIMDALPPDGSHTAIDPFQHSEWSGVGARQASRLTGRSFTLIEERSIHALPELIRAGRRFGLIFIDGNHRFDDVLVDFHLCDQLLEVGGIMAFDDLRMPSVRSVVNFVASNCAYERLPEADANMAAFRKRADDDRDWQHFVPFAVPQRPMRSRLKGLLLNVLGRGRRPT
jgi:predicted O-methyltransferase YrrM